jgi:WD40 repeat protein
MRSHRLRAITLLWIAVTMHFFLVWHFWAHAGPTRPETKDENTTMVRALIAQLGDNSYEKRQAAQRRLADIGEPALTALEQAAKDDSDIEIRSRANELLRIIYKSFLHEVRRYEGHAQEPQRKATRVVVTPDGRFAVTSGSAMLRYWDIEGGKQLLAFGPIARPSYWALALSKDGKRIIAGGEDNLATLYEVATGKQIQQFVGHTDLIRGAALLPDNKRAITGSWDKTIRLWDIETGKQLLAFDNVNESVRGLAVSPDGKILAGAHFGDKDKGPGTIRLWDIEKGNVIRTMGPFELPISTVCYASDGKTLLSSGFDGTLRLWDVASGKELKQFKERPYRIEFAVLTPDGRRILACGDQSSALQVWDVASGKLVAESEEVGGGMLCLAALPDNRRCLISSRDGLIRLWQWKR